MLQEERGVVHAAGSQAWLRRTLRGDRLPGAHACSTSPACRSSSSTGSARHICPAASWFASDEVRDVFGPCSTVPTSPERPGVTEAAIEPGTPVRIERIEDWPGGDALRARLFESLHRTARARLGLVPLLLVPLLPGAHRRRAHRSACWRSRALAARARVQRRGPARRSCSPTSPRSRSSASELADREERGSPRWQEVALARPGGGLPRIVAGARAHRRARCARRSSEASTAVASAASRRSPVRACALREGSSARRRPASVREPRAGRRLSVGGDRRRGRDDGRRAAGAGAALFGVLSAAEAPGGFAPAGAPAAARSRRRRRRDRQRARLRARAPASPHALTAGFVPQRRAALDDHEVGVLYEPAGNQASGGDVFGVWPSRRRARAADRRRLRERAGGRGDRRDGALLRRGAHIRLPTARPRCSPRPTRSCAAPPGGAVRAAVPGGD